MRKTFFGSENSRYLLGLEGREISLLRDYREIWQRTIDYSNFEIIGVGNNGIVFIKAEEGLLVYPTKPEEKEYLIPAFKSEALKNENSLLPKVIVDRTGERLCIEKVTYKRKLSEKLFKILSSSTARSEMGQVVHELIFYDVQSGRQVIFYKFPVDRKIPHAFSWSISPDFYFAIWGEAQKVFRGMETKFSVANVREQSIYDQFVLEGLTEWILFINNFGSSLIDSPQKKEQRELLVSNIESDKFRLTVENKFTPLHIGKHFLAFKSRMEPNYLFKRYDNSVIQEVDLSALDGLGIEYQTIFNDRDDIDFVALREGHIKVVHSNVDRFSIDAKRWQLMVEQQEIDSEIEKRKTTLEEKKKTLEEKRTQIKRQELSKTALAHKESRVKKKIISVESKMRELEELKMMLLSNRIGKYDYVKKKKKIENEIESLKSAIPGDKTRPMTPEVTADLEKPSTTVLPEYTKAESTKLFQESMKNQEAERSRSKGETMELSLEEELKKYIPTVAENEEKDQNSRSAPPQKREFVNVRITKPPTRKKKMPERIELDISSFKVKSKKKASDTQGLKKDGFAGETKIMSPLEKTERERPVFPTLDESAGIDEEKFPERTAEDEARLLEIRRQIEREIQEAVMRKKQPGNHYEEQKKKYLELLKELEESFNRGGISEKNYKKLRKKYEERINKIEEEAKSQ
ncbi:MAG: hypothetical protein K8T10_07745 [Candidatus Eremiobacteraeota bacterium]|nr:hypothetical protein [Candidatus Eremiobacteraeota bacterium]